MNTHTHTINARAYESTTGLNTHMCWSVLENITNVIENWKITGTRMCVKQKWENDIYIETKSRISLYFSFGWMFA